MQRMLGRFAPLISTSTIWVGSATACAEVEMPYLAVISSNPNPDPHNKLPTFRPTASWSRRENALNKRVDAAPENAKPMPLAPPAPKGAAGTVKGAIGQAFRTARRLFAGGPGRIIICPHTGEEIEVDDNYYMPQPPSTVAYGASGSLGGKCPEPA
jgi:hypothetical protein